MQRPHPVPTGQTKQHQLYEAKVSWHLRHRMHYKSVASCGHHLSRRIIFRVQFLLSVPINERGLRQGAGPLCLVPAPFSSVHVLRYY